MRNESFGYYWVILWVFVMIDLQTIRITPQMLNLIAEIDEFKGMWQQIHTLTPDRLSVLKKIATIESIGSSTRIEGAKLSDREIENLLARVDLHSFQSRDEQEVAGYAFVCNKIFDHFLSMPLSENSIKQLHAWLMQFSEKDVRHRGEYKKIPIRIEAFDSSGRSAGVIFETTSPLETPFRMEELISWVNPVLDKKELHPLLVIGIFIVVFLAIHPFQDGNGRLSRLLTTKLMLKCGYLYAPYSSLESVIEANKESYYLALQKTQKSWQLNQPDWSPWLLFFLQCLQRQKEHLQTKIDKENILLKKLPVLSRHILDLLGEHGRLKISDLVVLTQANRNTLKKGLASLVRDNFICPNGKGKATWYTLQ